MTTFEDCCVTSNQFMLHLYLPLLSPCGHTNTILAPAGSSRPPSLPLEPEDVLLLFFVLVGLSDFLMSEVLTAILIYTGFI